MAPPPLHEPPGEYDVNELPEKVLLLTINVPKLYIPPPGVFSAELEATILLLMVSIPPLLIPPPVFETIALRSEEHTSDLQSPDHLVSRLLLEKKKTISHIPTTDYLEDILVRAIEHDLSCCGLSAELIAQHCTILGS